MKRVIIESPLAGSRRQTKKNLEYARACIRDSLSRGEAPIASHVLYCDILDDQQSDERATGIQAGFAWGEFAELIAVYVDHGISPGMEMGIRHYKTMDIPCEMRSLVTDPLIIGILDEK